MNPYILLSNQFLGVWQFPFLSSVPVFFSNHAWTTWKTFVLIWRSSSKPIYFGVSSTYLMGFLTFLGYTCQSISCLLDFWSLCSIWAWVTSFSTFQPFSWAFSSLILPSSIWVWERQASWSICFTAGACWKLTQPIWATPCYWTGIWLIPISFLPHETVFFTRRFLSMLAIIWRIIIRRSGLVVAPC